MSIGLTPWVGFLRREDYGSPRRKRRSRAYGKAPDARFHVGDHVAQPAGLAELAQSDEPGDDRYGGGRPSGEGRPGRGVPVVEDRDDDESDQDSRWRSRSKPCGPRFSAATPTCRP
jgi:hypothetical protein